MLSFNRNGCSGQPEYAEYFALTIIQEINCEENRMMVAFILILNILYRNEKRQDWLYIYIDSIIMWVLFLFCGIEMFSINDSLSVLSIRLFWCIIDVTLLGVFIVLRIKRKYEFPRIKIEYKYSTPTIICLAASLIVVMISFYIAIQVVPYNWDSLTYHLPRIMHWVQNRSVAHYATNMSRQVSSPVLAEFVNLSVYLFCGESDFLFNLLQWASYVTCGVIAAGIARKLKCTYFWSCMAGFLFLTMPIAFAESITTQNDNFAAMWLLMFVYVLLDLYEKPKLNYNKFYVERTVVLSLCIAFGYLSKPSSMFAVTAFAIGLLILCLKAKSSFRNLLKLLGCAVGIVVLIIFPETIRVIITFEALSDPMVGNRQLIGTLNPAYVFINFLKNIFFNAPNAYFDINGLISTAIYFLAFRLKVNLDDPSISEDGRTFNIIPARTYHHNSAVNPVIFWGVIITVILTIIFYRKLKLTLAQKLYCVLAMGSFAVFCMFLRWEPFVSRYMISYLALLCPVIVLLLNRCATIDKGKVYAYSLTGIILFVSIVETIQMINFHMEAVGYSKANERGQAYFYICGEGNYGDYTDIVKYIEEKQYCDIGLLTGYDSFEYPLWQYLPKEGYRMEHIGVTNATKKYEDPEFIPDCIFVRDVEIESFDYHGIRYVKSDPNDTRGTFLLVPVSEVTVRRNSNE